MRAAVNAFALWSAAAALQAALFVGSAAAQDVEQDAEQGAARESESAEVIATEDGAEHAESSTRGSGQWGADRWVPSIAATSGITIQEWKGNVSSQQCNGCTLPNAAAVQLRPSASGDDRDVTPFVGGIFELMTPELPIPLSPRIFADGAFYGSFGFDRDIANEGQPGRLLSPLPPGEEQTQAFGEDIVLGQGSETEAQLQTFIYGADAGIAFPFEFYGRAFRLKPSIGWLRFKVEAKGAVADAECRSYAIVVGGQVQQRTNCNPNSPGPSPPPGVQRDTILQGNSTNTYDGVGGGLDLEMDAIRIGPLGSSLFIGAHAYKILGDRNLDFSAEQALPAFVPPTPGLGAIDTAAQWHYEIEEFVYRVGLGFKVQWLGSED